jgi:peptidoglycan/LPS O-acetylase OafA/YrhL
MNKALSVYLDFLRLLAATAVLVGHSQGYILPIIPNFIAGHADEGVAIFFVLSGFVIHYVLDEKEKDWRSYIIARVSRIFSVVLIALFATYIADVSGLMINPTYYHSILFFNDDYFPALLKALTFTNELWSRDSVFGSNSAYWSLGYEVQYYFVFGMIFFLPKKLGLLAATLWAIIVGPSITLYFSLWLMGVYLYSVVKNASHMPRKKAVFLFVLSILFYCILRTPAIHGYKSWITHPAENLEDARIVLFALFYYLCVGTAVFLNILSFKHIVGDSERVFGGAERAIRWLAGGSFTLYLVHQPLLTFARALIPGIGQTVGVGFAALLVIILLSYGLAELGERRKSYYKNFFLAVLRWLRWARKTAFANNRS